MRDNRFNGVGGGMNRRIGCIFIISDFSWFLFLILGCNSFGIWHFVYLVNCLWYNKVHVILNSSRVYCPCILGVEMPETRISIASSLVGTPWRVGSGDNE